MIAKLFPDLVSGVWAIKHDAAEGYLPLIVSFLSNPASFKGQDYSEERIKYRRIGIATLEGGSAMEDFEIPKNRDGKLMLDDIPSNTIITLNITDAITKYDQFCGPVGMQEQIRRLQIFDSHPNVLAILLKIDSPGGEGYAARSMASAIRSANKPVIAFVDDLAASAGYMIASAADEIYANSNMAEVGSIGTYLQIADFRKQLEAKGITLHEIYASASVDKNKEFKEALSGNYEPLRQFANTFNDMFLDSVKSGRESKLTADEKVWGTGKVFFADKALDIGLIDGILTYEQTLETIFENLI